MSGIGKNTAKSTGATSLRGVRHKDARRCVAQFARLCAPMAERGTKRRFSETVTVEDEGGVWAQRRPPTPSMPPTSPQMCASESALEELRVVLGIQDDEDNHARHPRSPVLSPTQVQYAQPALGDSPRYAEGAWCATSPIRDAATATETSPTRPLGQQGQWGPQGPQSPQGPQGPQGPPHQLVRPLHPLNSPQSPLAGAIVSTQVLQQQARMFNEMVNTITSVSAIVNDNAARLQRLEERVEIQAANMRRGAKRVYELTEEMTRLTRDANYIQSKVEELTMREQQYLACLCNWTGADDGHDFFVRPSPGGNVDFTKSGYNRPVVEAVDAAVNGAYSVVHLDLWMVVIAYTELPRPSRASLAKILPKISEAVRKLGYTNARRELGYPCRIPKGQILQVMPRALWRNIAQIFHNRDDGIIFLPRTVEALRVTHVRFSTPESKCTYMTPSYWFVDKAHWAHFMEHGGKSILPDPDSELKLRPRITRN
jgi:hypothetical protein